MATRGKKKGADTTQPAESIADYRFDAKRTNIPPAGLAAQGKLESPQRIRYEYDPHRSPALRFDGTGVSDKLPELLAIARQRALTDDEAKQLSDALRTHQPWLEWASKRERRWFDVEPVALHIHERIAAQAIVKVAARQDVQRDLFADPKFSYREAVQFYQHDMDWTNRMILGDSLQVMASLARRESLAGRVQMIYIDPPYGIKFASNFQPEVGKREVKDKESDLTREPEMVKAYRDTWTLGVHSYLAYLRDRLMVPADDRFPNAVLVVCPNLTIFERLQVLRTDTADNYYQHFDVVPAQLMPELHKGKVLISNWHKFSPESPHVESGKSYVVVDKGEESPDAFARRVLGDLHDRAPIMVLNDEAHHAYRPKLVEAGDKLSAEEKSEREEATVWVSGLDRINAACGVKFVVDLPPK